MLCFQASKPLVFKLDFVSLKDECNEMGNKVTASIAKAQMASWMDILADGVLNIKCLLTCITQL